MSRRVAVATNNAHKVEEIRSAFVDSGWKFYTLSELDIVSDPEETGVTFEENAFIKAKAVHELTGLAVLADDSGLEVDALGGRPGVYSSRYAGESATDDENNAKLFEGLGGVEFSKRAARFKSVLVFLDEEGDKTVVSGVCEGRIGTSPKGDYGFGYDPLFLPDAVPGKSMAELTMNEKNAISHRGMALRNLAKKLLS